MVSAKVGALLLFAAGLASLIALAIGVVRTSVADVDVDAAFLTGTAIVAEVGIALGLRVRGPIASLAFAPDFAAATFDVSTANSRRSCCAASRTNSAVK